MTELEDTDITIEDEIEVEQGDLDSLDERKSKILALDAYGHRRAR